MTRTRRWAAGPTVSGAGRTHALPTPAAVFPFLADVPPHEQEAAGLVTARLPAGTPAFMPGEPCQHVAFVLGGSIRVFKSSETGRELTLYHVTRGDSCILMWSSVLADAPYPAQAVVAADADVLLVPAEAFRSWMERYGAVRQFVYDTLVKRLADVLLLVDEIVFRQVDQRLASALLERADPASGDLHVTHEGLALELGTAREVVSRILKSFEQEGLVRLGRRRITVTDRGGLTAKRAGTAL